MSEPVAAMRWVDRLLAGAWVLLGCAFLVALVLQIAPLLPLSRPQTVWENAPLDIAWQVREGKPMYADWRTGPVHVGVYGPAYYRLLGTIGRVWNLDRIAMIDVGRGLSVGAFGVAIVLLVILATRNVSRPCAAGTDGQAARKPACAAPPAPGLDAIRPFGETGSERYVRYWAWAIPLVVLGSIPVQSVEFITSSRPDTIALALTMAGLLLAMRPGRWNAVGAAAAMALAMFSKPTSVAAPVTIALAMIWEADRKRLLGVLGLLGAGVIGGVIALQVSTGGLFWMHQHVTLAAPQKWAYSLFVLTKGRVEDQPRFLAAMVAIALLTRFARPGFGGLSDSLCRSWRWAAAYLFATTLVAIVTSRRQGSNINYLIEPILASGWVLSLWAQSLAATTNRTSKNVGRLLAGITLFNPSLMYLDSHVITARQVAETTRILGANYTEGAAWIRTLPQPLLSLDPWLAYCSGVEGYVNDPIAFGSMCQTRPDEDVLTARVRRRFFACVVTFGRIEEVPGFVHQEIRTPWAALEAALLENYVLAERHGPWYRYVPR